MMKTVTLYSSPSHGQQSTSERPRLQDATSADLVQSKPGELVEDVEITEPLGTSDHNVAKFKRPVPINEDNWKTEYYDYRQANIKNMRTYNLNQTQWKDKATKTEEMWKRFRIRLKKITLTHGSNNTGAIHKPPKASCSGRGPSFRPTGTPQPTCGKRWELVRILIRILALGHLRIISEIQLINQNKYRSTSILTKVRHTEV